MATFKSLKKEFDCGMQLARKKWNSENDRVTTVIVKNNNKIQMQKTSTMKAENNAMNVELTSADKKANDWYVVNPNYSCGEGCGCLMSQEEAEKAQNEAEKK